jgi:hypothetical protein
MIRPLGVQINTVIPNQKQHIDLVYVAIPKINMQQPCVNKKEASQARWFTAKEVVDSNLHTFESVQQWVQKIAQEWQTLLIKHDTHIQKSI